jgi:enamine deaminase RidA (YjgF/YER057c/UK114 family)
MARQGSSAASPANTVCREKSPGQDLTVLKRQGMEELHLTLRPLPNENPKTLVARLAGVLRQHQASVVRHELFGDLSGSQTLLAELHQQFGTLAWPVSWIEGADCRSGQLAGMHVQAVAGPRVEPVLLRGTPVGCVFNDGLARHCLLGDLRAQNVTQSRSDQAEQVYAAMEAAFAAAAMGMRDVVRTWFFLDDILGWYGDFNAVRTRLYREKKVLAKLVPASTGVGAKNPGGSAVLAEAWALQPVDGALTVRELMSPKQCPAPEYGSTFSRAIELSAPEYRRVIVSGTASIEPGGRSVCAGDVDAQIDLTMEVVRAILVSRGMDFSDATRVTAYLRNPSDAPVFARWCARNGQESWPLITTQATICRDELLFEIELDAASTAAVPPVAPPHPRNQPSQRVA